MEVRLTDGAKTGRSSRVPRQGQLRFPAGTAKRAWLSPARTGPTGPYRYAETWSCRH